MIPLDAWRARDAKDAWGRPVRVQFANANPPRFQASSDGADGVKRATWADGQASLAQRAGEMSDVVGKLAVFGDL